MARSSAHAYGFRASRPRGRWSAGAAFGIVALALSLFAASAQAQASNDAGSRDGGGTDAASVSSDGGAGADAGTVITARSRLDDAIAKDKDGHPAEAMRLARDALERSWASSDHATEIAAREALVLFRTHTAKVWFAVREDVKELELKFDDRMVAEVRLKKGYFADPGKHIVVASGLVGGEPSTFEQEVTLTGGENKLIDVALTKAEAMCSICEDPPPCIKYARSENEVEKCLKAQRGCGGCASSGEPIPALETIVFPLVALAFRWSRRRKRTDSSAADR